MVLPELLYIMYLFAHITFTLILEGADVSKKQITIIKYHVQKIKSVVKVGMFCAI